MSLWKTISETGIRKRHKFKESVSERLFYSAEYQAAQMPLRKSSIAFVPAE